MSRFSALLLILPAMFLGSGMIQALESDAADALIARLWLERADVILSAGQLTPQQLTDASEALEIAGEFLTPNSDSMYLEARLIGSGGRPGSSIRVMFDLLGKSLDAGPAYPGTGMGSLIGFEDRARLWSSAALRLREYREILNRFGSWPAGHRIDPALLYAAARAALYLGRDSEAAELARRGEALADSGTDLSEMGVPVSTSVQAPFRAIAVAAGHRESIETLDAAWRRWGDGLEKSILPWVLTGHIRRTDTPVLDTLMSPASLAAIAVLEPGSVQNSAVPDRVRTDLALLRRAGLDRNEILTGYTGTLVADAEYDGYQEETLRLVNGLPVYRRIDSDQDGVPEWEIDYVDGFPIQIGWDDGRLKIRFEIDSYPSVLSVVSVQDQLEVTVSFHPGAFRWMPVPPDSYLTFPVEPTWNQDDLWMGAREVRAVKRGSPDGNVTVARTFLQDGFPLRAIEHRYPEGSPSDELWIREILYQDGRAAAGRLSYRTDPRDRRRRLWELYERYENGRLVGLAWDPGMTGSPSYLRDWALDRYLVIQVWDVDGDNWVDYRHLTLPGGAESSRNLMVTEASLDDMLPWTASDWAPWEN